MKSTVAVNGGPSSVWSTVSSWLFSSVSLSIAAPIFLYRVYGYVRQSRRTDTLPDKVVVITGASSGLGESLAHAFYKAGCKVVLAARRMDELQRVRSELLESHVRDIATHPPVCVQLDLAQLATLPQKIADILAIHGHIDILVNNGGISVRADVLGTGVDIDVQVMQVNYLGAVALTKAALPSMIARRSGRIVYVGSVQGKVALPQRSAYGASKHALGAFADSLRAEVHADGVRVLHICAGYINTALSLNALTASGEKHGRMDAATAAGLSADDAAAQVVQAVLDDGTDVWIAPWHLRLVPVLRAVAPNVFFWAMRRQAAKNRRLKAAEDAEKEEEKRRQQQQAGQ